MQRLADVELQLVMHGLEASELLRFARCCQQMMHAADSAVAWLHSSPLRIRLPTDSSDALGFVESSRLLRRASVCAVVSPPSNDSSTLSTDFWRDFDRLATSEREIQSLDASECELTPITWGELLGHPWMHSLRIVRCGLLPEEVVTQSNPTEPSSMLRVLLRTLPHLHTLQFRVSAFDPNKFEFHRLLLMTQLTSLDVTLHSNEQRRLLMLIKECAKLRELTLYDLATPFGHPQLRSLKLVRFNAGKLSSEAELGQMFRGLANLQSLSLVECRAESVESILAQLHLAPALTSVTLRPDLEDALDDTEPFDRDPKHCARILPPMHVVANALTRCAQLRSFTIVCSYDGPEQPTNQFLEAMERQWKRMMTSQELAPFGARFQMRVDHCSWTPAARRSSSPPRSGSAQ